MRQSDANFSFLSWCHIVINMKTYSEIKCNEKGIPFFKDVTEMEQKLYYICATILIKTLHVWLTDMLDISDSYSQNKQ